MSDSALQAFQTAALVEDNARSDKRYTEFLRVPAMSAGIYRLPDGGEDLQQPHAQDEVYYVLRGCSKFTCNGEEIDARPGSFIYVAARADHRFFDIEEELEIIVLFAPAEDLAG